MSTIHVFFTHDGRRYVAGVEETPWEAPTSPVADTWTTVFSLFVLPDSRRRFWHLVSESMPRAVFLPLTTEAVVQAQNALITAYTNANSGRQVRAIVFATGAENAKWAALSVRNTPGTLVDLDYGPWLTAGLPPWLAHLDFLDSSTRVDSSPAGLRLARPFYLLFAEQDGVAGVRGGNWVHPPNTIVNKLVVDSPVPWVGNVLAVRCGPGGLGFADFQDTDMQLVVASVKRHILVRVPVHTGVLRPTSVDQLDTEIWFDAGRGIASPTSDLTGRTFEVERFPDNAPQDLEHSFTFVVAPQHSRGPNVHAVNQTILQFAPDLSPPVRGNVLVFRHGGPPRKYLADMEEQYWIAVTHIASV
ncbi:hypothetical protein B0H15DRAFT_797416 [Mycena belliarum]|uniref:Uncharacterized protein n=1 Tax=Mycena belliarum TaxID=1033014 RepID=A0AAD6UCD1_9AGAR|nr:hypothetical protein B0H15DRAFT_797416 [Mycena belliae]